ncbi:Gfo/Idh/MocA family protein [Desulforamulus ruminis]|uniref:Oxidoreductase domain protein n=1 Tax=Desulforamulus ruminis (strain ATCC 23193 / DSM 2154 / NCIMB 8452 / DL) TaxID=696281 RepID=F6DQQ8_DESRL|nr:Gfo/Idh/MocA family oxidoreductase [Desulforamulus ruminis]AEG62055.1 oxidoreductase domain protein [Desulforamulus ruminis DSM 2154]
MIRVGLIGAGRMGWAHAEKLSKMPDVSLVAVQSHTGISAQELAEAFGAKAYTDYKRMLDHEKLDVVYITTPVYAHYDTAMAVIQRKLDLFLEKPISLSLGEAAALVEKVKEAEILCAIGHMFRYRRSVQAAAGMLAQRPVSMLNGFWYWTKPPVKHIADKDLGGGPVVDQLIHLIDLCRLFCGDVESVHAFYTLNVRQNEDFNNWDGYVLNLKFKNGVVGSISGTLALFPDIKEERNFETIALDIAAKNLLFRFTPQKTMVLSETGMEMDDSQTGDINDQFIQAVRTRSRGLIKTPIEDSYKTLAVVLAANDSAQTGKPVVIDDFIEQSLMKGPCLEKGKA